MTSGGNNCDYFPENQLTKFIAVPLQKKFNDATCVTPPLGWTPLAKSTESVALTAFNWLIADTSYIITERT